MHNPPRGSFRILRAWKPHEQVLFLCDVGLLPPCLQYGKCTYFDCIALDGGPCPAGTEEKQLPSLT